MNFYELTHLVLGQDGDKWGLMTPDEECFIIPPIYDEVKTFTVTITNVPLAAVKKDGKWGYIDEHNNTIIPFIYEDATSFMEGVASVKKNGKWGYINPYGDCKCSFVYEDADVFNEHFAWVKLQGKWGFIDKSYRYVVKPTFEVLDGPFFKGLTRIIKDGKLGIIDINGHYRLPPFYDYVGYINYIEATTKLIDFDNKGIMTDEGFIVGMYQDLYNTWSKSFS